VGVCQSLYLFKSRKAWGLKTQKKKSKTKQNSKINVVLVLGDSFDSVYIGME
jgi:hypothetical protein